MLDLFGETIPVSVLDGEETRTVTFRELAGQAEHAKNLASRFQELIAKHREGDAIIWYSSPRQKWEALMGHEGYALVRDGYLVDAITLRMN